MEDIAGLRLPPCADWHSQDELAQLIEARFPDAFRRDRRKTPSAGYRAVHLIVRGTNGCAVEIQIRTHLQHAWAEIFEKFTDLIGREYRYGAVPTAPGARVVFETLQKVAETFHGAEEATEGLRLAEGVPQVSESRAALLDQAHRLVVSSKARCQKVIDILPSVLAEFEAPSDQPSSGEV